MYTEQLVQVKVEVRVRAVCVSVTHSYFLLGTSPDHFPLEQQPALQKERKSSPIFTSLRISLRETPNTDYNYAVEEARTRKEKEERRTRDNARSSMNCPMTMTMGIFNNGNRDSEIASDQFKTSMNSVS